MSETSDDDALVFVPPTEEAAPTWPPERLELPLRKPVSFGAEEVIETINLREPTSEEWEEINEHPLKTRRRFAVSRIAGIPMGAAAKIGIGDLIRAESYLYAFFEVGQTIRDW